MTRRAVDPATKARALQLVERMSPADAAAQLVKEGHAEVNREAIRLWVKAAKAPGAQAAAHTALGIAVPAARPSPAPRHRKREGEEDLPPELQGLDPDAMDLSVLSELDQKIGEQIKLIEGDPDETKVWIALVRLRMDLRSAMAKMRPRAVVDPDEDPLSLAARDLALAKIRKALAAGGGV